MKNKIKIPWYRRNVQIPSGEDMGNNPISFSIPTIPNGNSRMRRPQPQEQRVRSPVTEPVKSPIKLPTLEGEAEIKPFPFPFPIPTPKENENKPVLPFPDLFPNPFPQKFYIGQTANGYTEDQIEWGSSIIKQMEYTSYVAGVASSEIYYFVRDYNYDNFSLPTFQQDASAKFGGVAATLLTVLIVGKNLVNTWGKRVSYAFSPPIDLDDDYFDDYFNENSKLKDF